MHTMNYKLLRMMRENSLAVYSCIVPAKYGDFYWNITLR